MIDWIRKTGLRVWALRFGLMLDQYSYKIIKKFIAAPGEVHPKHDILRYDDFFVDNVGEDDVVLDLRCGNGSTAYALSKKAKEVIGIDISEKNVAFAKKNFEAENLSFRVGDALTEEFEERITVIVLSNVLEHIEKRVEFLEGLAGISDRVLLRVPMLTRDWLTVFKKDFGVEYRLDTTHFIEFRLEELMDELDRSGWQMDEYSIQFGECWGVVTRKA